MSGLISSFLDTVKKIVGKFDTSQMIAVGVVLLIAVLLGFLIGALALYRSGVKKGKKAGMREVVTLAMEKAEENLSERVEEAIAEEKQKREEMLAEKDREIQDLTLRLQEAELAKEAAEQEKATAEQAMQEAQKTKEQAEQAALAAEKTKEEAAQTALEAEKSKAEAEQARVESEQKLRDIEEREAAETAAKEGKKELTLLSKKEILDYAGALDEYLPASVYERGGADLPDSCRVGICTFLLVYERKGMVKLVLRLHKKTASALQKQFKLFTPAVYPKGEDWYKWILSSEVTDLSIVTAAIRMAYKYAFVSNYDEETKEINVELANRYEMLINEAILKYKDLPDRDFVVASDAAEGGNAAFRLYGKEEMTDYALGLQKRYPVTVSVGSGELSPNTFKVGGKTFLMAYEKDGVAKMIFRVSEEKFALLKQKHPTADISSFPKAKGYHWYVVNIDETFFGNEDIEEIIKDSCAHVNSLS